MQRFAQRFTCEHDGMTREKEIGGVGGREGVGWLEDH